MEHYFTKQSESEQIKKRIDHVIQGQKMTFITSNAVFSKDAVDFGSHLLLDTLLERDPLEGKLLDVGGGYGALGITLAKFNPNLQVVMADVNERAVALANENAVLAHVESRVKALVSDGCDQVEGHFDWAVTNPPIRAGKAVVFKIYEDIYQHLGTGGSLFVVIQKKQGAPSTMDKLVSLFGQADLIARKSGYHIIMATKQGAENEAGRA